MLWKLQHFFILSFFPVEIKIKIFVAENGWSRKFYINFSGESRNSFLLLLTQNILISPVRISWQSIQHWSASPSNFVVSERTGGEVQCWRVPNVPCFTSLAKNHWVLNTSFSTIMPSRKISWRAFFPNIHSGEGALYSAGSSARFIKSPASFPEQKQQTYEQYFGTFSSPVITNMKSKTIYR